MLCNRQIKECIICYDSSSFISQYVLIVTAIFAIIVPKNTLELLKIRNVLSVDKFETRNYINL